MLWKRRSIKQHHGDVARKREGGAARKQGGDAASSSKDQPKRCRVLNKRICEETPFGTQSILIYQALARCSFGESNPLACCSLHDGLETFRKPIVNLQATQCHSMVADIDTQCPSCGVLNPSDDICDICNLFR